MGNVPVCAYIHAHTVTQTHTHSLMNTCSIDMRMQYEFMELTEELEVEAVWVANIGISQSESTNPDELLADGWLQVGLRRGLAQTEVWLKPWIVMWVEGCVQSG